MVCLQRSRRIQLNQARQEHFVVNIRFSVQKLDVPRSSIGKYSILKHPRIESLPQSHAGKRPFSKLNSQVARNLSKSRIQGIAMICEPYWHNPALGHHPFLDSEDWRTRWDARQDPF